ncbi:hypothetical protein KDX38_18450 [Pseudomonas sp. CDFA 602]|uniref:hypothetical protein n=1 Tax=Pseudomonas californiensis TaxID=2829823 RepID=UPI001E300F69|nr:hypothetical protein [Pseudomonas californiensis]MCD5995595.1 hypothetical protein [Pseudomonas californiensis]MCD6001189.1 hypothetical protein [Pseudomonas californiensis]
MSNVINRFNSLNRVSISVFYIVTVALLLLANFSTINAVTHEAGDFAANSVLIQRAKDFSLWVGNYSRVGFNHPGPAILYVLAAGETVFHDVLHLVDFPFAGQIMAVAFYNAFWITLAFVGFHRLTQSTLVALACVSVLLLMLGLIDYSFFNGIWMPHMYLFPFVVALMAIGRVIDGKIDSLQALAISSGFLINGHVSFVGVLGVVLITAIVSNYLIFRGQAKTDRIIASPSFLVRHKVPLGLSCLTLFLFFIPLVIKTITDFPGPIHDYATFSGGHNANSLADSLVFVASYWGGVLWGALGLGLLTLAWWACGRMQQEARTRIRALVASIFAATFALLFYARYGIDMLSERYVGLFYYAAPSLAIAYSVMVLLSSTRLGSFKAVLLPGSLVVLAVTFSVINKPVPYTQHYGLPGIKTTFNALQSQRTTGNVLVLDLDTANNWPHVWSSVAGLEAFSARKGIKLFCVNQNWHILFTKAYRCSDEEVRSGKRLTVTAYNGYPDKTPALSAMGLSFYSDEVFSIAGRGALTVVKDRPVFSRDLLASGWAGVEADRVWSEDKQARLLFKTTAQSAGHVKLDLEAFLPTPQSSQLVTFVLDGKQVGQAKFSPGKARQTISIPVAASDQVQTLQLQIDKPISPQSAGLSDDARELGVALFGLEFDGVAKQ